MSVVSVITGTGGTGKMAVMDSLNGTKGRDTLAFASPSRITFVSNSFRPTSRRMSRRARRSSVTNFSPTPPWTPPTGVTTSTWSSNTPRSKWTASSTPTVWELLELLKRALKGTYVAGAPFHLFRYLDEQAFRFNIRKWTDALRFVAALKGVIAKRLTLMN